MMLVAISSILHILVLVMEIGITYVVICRDVEKLDKVELTGDDMLKGGGANEKKS